ncbi:hypothetical protein B0H14DRAFT_3655259 [Mycena olivaceomarginata]|nr:hypothetical protein B0H14DRAFT_3655259 [Mycena olivaceomarginata]
MLSNTADFALFDAAADFTTGEVVEYRRFMFPLLLGDSTHVPFFSVEDAPRWMTARGYALYQELNLAERLDPLRDHRYASLRQLRAYREQVVGEAYVNHPFFQVDRAEDWVAPAPFNTWMRLMQELEAERGRKVNRSEAGSIRSYTPGSSVAASPPRSRTMSLAGRSDRLSCSPRSRSSSVHPNSRCSYGTGSGFSSRAASPSTILAFDVDIPSMIQPLHVESPPAPPETTAIPQGTVTSKSSRRRGKGKGQQVEEDPDPRIKVIRELYVNRIIPVTTAPQTWTVPRDEVAYKLDVRANPDVLKNKKGNKMRTIDTYIKAEDQDAWDGSTGHAGPKGDVWVYAFSGERVRARRAQLRCKGICVCEFVSEELFGNCERFEPDEQAMRDLWNHKLDANEREAASPEAILSRVQTIRQAVLHWVFEWHPGKRWLHRYHSIPPNVDEEIFRYVLENKGRVPDGTVLNLNIQCVLSTHPRLGLKHCVFSHVLDGVIHPAKLLQRRCDTELIILILVLPPDDPTSPNYYEWLPEYAFQAILILRNGHNHPAHPHIKPSAEDERLLGAAMDALGTENLTVQTLLNGKSQSTQAMYDGKRVSAVSPAFADVRKIRDRIAAHRKVEFPAGTGFSGVQHYMQTKDRALPVSERYIHAAMSKGDFNLVVTLHPQLAKFIHGVLALAIDYTFKRIEGDMDEWEVVGFSERFKCRIPFASFYCDRKTKPAFEQLFIEFFDAVYRVTGDKFHLRPFYPDANCRVFVMDGEVAQVQGFGEFLAQYNSPSISGIVEGNSLEYVAYCLKTCVPLDVVKELRKILGARTKQRLTNGIDWYAQKLANPWYPPFYQPIPLENCSQRLQSNPKHHKSRRECTCGNERSNIYAARTFARNPTVDEIHQIIRDGVMRKRWNGPSEREKLSAQRKGWAAKAAFERNEHLIAFNELSQEREEGQEEWKFSLSRQKAIQGEIEELQEQLKVDRRREDLKTEVKVLRLEIDAEKQNRRDWVSRRGEIDAKLRELRTGPLKGVQIQGRHTPIDSNSDAPIPASTDNSNDATISDATGNSRSDEPTSNMTLYLTDTDTQMESHPGFELDPELEPNHESKSTFIWSLSTLHSPVSLVFNDNTLQMDNTDSGFGFNIGLASTTPTHSDSDLLQMITASATLPSVSVPGPAVLALATTPAARRRRRQSVDENDIVEGSRQRTQSKRARGEA